MNAQQVLVVVTVRGDITPSEAQQQVQALLADTATRCPDIASIQVLDAEVQAALPAALHDAFTPSEANSALQGVVVAAENLLAAIDGVTDEFNEEAKALEVALGVAGPVLALYGDLHDTLSDCIEDGRLTRAMLPDDYPKLVNTLTELAGTECVAA